MKRFNLFIFPSYVTDLYNAGTLDASQLMDRDKWGNIFSGNTVKKINQLNSFQGGGVAENEFLLNHLGLNWVTSYVEPIVEIPPKFRLLETLMSDGRESECDLIFNQIHNFGASFDYVRAANGTYLILLNNLHPLDDIQNRYVLLRSNMGKLIDDMSSLVDHDDIVCEPIVQSYMMIKN